MSVLDDIGIAVTELTDEVLYPPWLVELAERCRRELDELPPRAQPTWYRAKYKQCFVDDTEDKQEEDE